MGDPIGSLLFASTHPTLHDRRQGHRRNAMASLRRGGLAPKHLFAILLVTLLLAASASAHEHETEDVGPYEDNFMNDEPVDRILQWHIGIQAVTWGLLFPAGMVRPE